MKRTSMNHSASKHESQSEQHNIFPSWSPDGKLIVFTSHREGPEDNMTIYTMKPDGTGLQQLSDQQAFLARFSPDGARVGFLTERYPRNAIYVMNSDGSGLKKKRHSRGIPVYSCLL